MEHLDFVDKLCKFGISIRTTNIENSEKEFEELNLFGEPRRIIVKNFNVEYKGSKPCDSFSGKNALKAMIRNSIDMDTWKHSWHNEIEPDNYQKFIDIIQEKILDRANQIDELLTTMFVLRKEIS